MAATQADLDAIDAAMRTGVQVVVYPGGGSVTYRSMQEMVLARSMIADDLNLAAGVRKPRRLKIYSIKDL